MTTDQIIVLILMGYFLSMMIAVFAVLWRDNPEDNLLHVIIWPWWICISLKKLMWEIIRS